MINNLKMANINITNINNTNINITYIYIYIYDIHNTINIQKSLFRWNVHCSPDVLQVLTRKVLQCPA